MSRVIAGIAGGTRLVTVPGTGTRPTTDRVKEALFSRLDAVNMISGARVLDLFAGSGALGVEAASRGASTVELVELDARAAAVCQKNAAMVNGVLNRRAVTVRRGKAGAFLDGVQPGRHWDLVFMDPPYPLEEGPLSQVLALLARCLDHEALVVVERSARSPEPSWPSGLVRSGERKYGETMLWFAEPSEEQPPGTMSEAADTVVP